MKTGSVQLDDRSDAGTTWVDLNNRGNKRLDSSSLSLPPVAFYAGF